jgi:BirA family biotin operon repressor/biotin-[acetyl-CoA-carboxylase] ligase
MRILTDTADRCASLVPSQTNWKTLRASALDHTERNLWRVLGATSAAFTAQPAIGASNAFWRRLIIIAQAPRSQFDAVHEALADELSLDGPTAVLALGGHGFRGQRSRPWSTLAGNLFLTLAVPVGAPAAELVAGLIMLPSVGVVDAICACRGWGPRPTIKWVNDVFINGRKVAGVLTASVCRQETLEAAVFGLGVNVTRTPAVEPTPFVPAAGSLSDAGICVTLGRFLWCVLDKFAERYRALVDQGPAHLLRSYREASCVLGRSVRIWDESIGQPPAPQVWPAPLAVGVVKSIQEDLSLRIEGHEEPVVGGRLAFEESCATFGV